MLKFIELKKIKPVFFVSKYIDHLCTFLSFHKFVWICKQYHYKTRLEGERMTTNFKNIDLTASEIQALWFLYQAQSLNLCMTKYFNAIVEDSVIKQINEETIKSSEMYLREIEEIFESVQHQIPVAYSEDDILTYSEKLYTDPFILYYQWFVAKGNLTLASISINTIAREDVFKLFEKVISLSVVALDQARRTLLEKGLWIRAPYIPVSSKVEFVQKPNFMNDWFGEKRPILGSEIASCFYNILTNTIGLALMKSFIQVSENEEIRKYFVKGKEIAKEHVEVLSKVLKDEDIQTPTTWNGGITSCTVSPFSDRYMLSLINMLNSQGLNNYGNAISTALRKDISLTFTRLSAEVLKFAEEGGKILMNKQWFEEPPHALRH